MTRDIPWSDDEKLGEAFRSLLATAPTTVRVLTLNIFARRDMDRVANTAKELTSVIEQAVMRLPRLDLVTLGVSASHELDLERRADIIHSQIPAEILGSGILRVVRARKS